jgi:uncharacterized protein with ParB-like and HNH nuclease domain
MASQYDGDYDEKQELGVDEFEIISSPNDFNITTIYSFIKSGTLIIPEFQRNYVWDIKRASKLIESILMGLPIPQIFLYEQSRNQFLVIDGQQRLMSLYYFMERRFPIPEKRIELRSIFAQKGKIPDEVLHDNNYFKDFNLKLTADTPGVKSKFNSLNYSTLDQYRSTFDLRTIRNIIIKQTKPENDDSCIYEIFNRLNTGGVNLKPQEIRTSLYHSKFYSMLYQINADYRWREFLGDPNPDINMKDIEILLRAYSMLIDGKSYKPSMLRFLNKFSKDCKTLTQEQVDYLKTLFLSFLNCCKNLEKNAFLGRAGKFNISTFEAVFRAICLNAYKLNNDVSTFISLEKLNSLKTNADFIVATQSSIASAANVKKRLDLAEIIFKNSATE